MMGTYETDNWFVQVLIHIPLEIKVYAEVFPIPPNSKGAKTSRGGSLLFVFGS